SPRWPARTGPHQRCRWRRCRGASPTRRAASARRASTCPKARRQKRERSPWAPFYQARCADRLGNPPYFVVTWNAMHHVDFGLLVLRASLGLMLMAHGANKVKGGLDNAGNWFASMGLKPGWFHGRLAAFSELTGGALLVLGLLTPVAAAIVIGV